MVGFHSLFPRSGGAVAVPLPPRPPESVGLLIEETALMDRFHETPYDQLWQETAGSILIHETATSQGVPGVAAADYAFPGAEGFGRLARGGRGGDTYHVTNLDDDFTDPGVGSFRYGLDNQDGPRTIVFDVAGTITLSNQLVVRESFCTISGQTAPFPGICLRDYGLEVRDVEHVIVRYLRSRLGDRVERDGSSLFVLNSRDIMVDHCSISWGVDETGAAWKASTATRVVGNITFQHCIFSEGLHLSVHSKGAHSMGCIAATEGFTLHHCLFAHDNLRNPFIRGAADLVNNVIYNWGQFGTHIQWVGEDPAHLIALGAAAVNLDNNYYQSGVNSTGSQWFWAFESPDVGKPTVWDSGGNLLDGSPTPALPGSPILATSRHEFPQVITESASDAMTAVLAGAGASNFRDSVDQRMVDDVTNGTGGIIDSQDDVGGWPF